MVVISFASIFLLASIAGAIQTSMKGLLSLGFDTIVSCKPALVSILSIFVTLIDGVE